MIKTFYKDYSDKPIVRSPPIDSAPLISKSMTKSIVKPLNVAKRKYGRLVQATIKQTKKV